MRPAAVSPSAGWPSPPQADRLL